MWTVCPGYLAIPDAPVKRANLASADFPVPRDRSACTVDWMTGISFHPGRDLYPLWLDGLREPKATKESRGLRDLLAPRAKAAPMVNRAYPEPEV